jgi:phosphoenolpyruvate carboxykinase (GTP)
MAMLPFCGYDMGTYFQHWLDMQKRVPLPPKIFMVNWFRQNANGKFVWPGFGENMRVLKWVIDRARGKVGGHETLIGWVPRPGDLDLQDLQISEEDVVEATKIDYAEWAKEFESQGEWFDSLGPTVPQALRLQRELLMARLK